MDRPKLAARGLMTRFGTIGRPLAQSLDSHKTEVSGKMA
jgi:hypothetical protein